MTGETPPDAAIAASPPPPRGSRVAWYAAAFAFLVGIGTMVALLPVVERWRTPATPAASTAQPVVGSATAQIDPAVPITLEGLASREAALDAKLNAIEARLTVADAASRDAAGNATRAERLLLATAVRRELNRGLPLGPLETLLHSQFDADQPQAVAVIIAAARQPVTLEDLRAALDTIAPTLSTGTMRDGVWPAVKRELSNLVVLRRESTPSPRPADRLTRTRRMLDAGNVEGAMAEVARLPGAVAATSWLEAAKRYVEARRALSRLELTALPATPAATPATPPAPPPEI